MVPQQPSRISEVFVHFSVVLASQVRQGAGTGRKFLSDPKNESSIKFCPEPSPNMVPKQFLDVAEALRIFGSFSIENLPEAEIPVVNFRFEPKRNLT